MSLLQKQQKPNIAAIIAQKEQTSTNFFNFESNIKKTKLGRQNQFYILTSTT